MPPRDRVLSAFFALGVVLSVVPCDRARAGDPAAETAGSPAAAPSAEPAPAEREAPVVQARLVDRPGRPGHRAVLEVRPFRRGAGRVDWSLQGDVIVFDTPGAEGRRELRSVRPDGGGERCLTCDAWLLRGVSALDPAFHPSGDLIVFAGQELPRRMRLDAETLATPLGAVHSELWMVRGDGRDAWQLSKLGERGRTVAAPRFSHEADRLAWSERQRTDVEPWGDWVVQVARLEVERGVPRLGAVEAVAPGPPGLRLLSGFGADDRSLLVAASLPPSGAAALDVLVVPIGGSRSGDPPRNLTRSPDDRDAVGMAAPRSDALVYASDRGIAPPPGGVRLPYRGDLWVRHAGDDGLPVAAERLTFFNDPRSDHHLGEALIDDVAWAPAGDRLLVHVVWAAPGGIEEGLYLVVLDPARLPGGEGRGGPGR